MTATIARPYGWAAEQYWAAGWRGVLPLPPKRKGPPPVGWTGHGGAWPSAADVYGWRDGPEGLGNLGLRLPDGVLGIDVDAYGTKQGAATLSRLLDMWGPLPNTWRSTSREDGVSGIALYRVPMGLAWPGELGPGIELIQHAHRYVVAWPSIHPEGGTYVWIAPTTNLPDPELLPLLPQTWVDGITSGRTADDLTAKLAMSDDDVRAWLDKYGGGPPCDAMVQAVQQYVSNRLVGASSRHDAARDATARLFAMAMEGHTGALRGVARIGEVFRDVTGADARRAVDRDEWLRLCMGAVRLAAAKADITADVPTDPCAALLDVTVLVPPPAGPAAGPTFGSPAVPQGDPLAEALAREVAQQRLRREAKRLLDEEEARKSFTPPASLFSLVEELALPDEPVAYAVERVMPNGANVLLTAQYKTGKTTMVNHLVRCIADNTPFLGRFNVTQRDGRVALFNYEVDRAQYRRWLREVGIEHPERVAPLNLRGISMPMLTGTVQEYVIRWLQERAVRVWVVDPFARALVGSGDGNENDNALVGRFLDTLDVIKHKAGVAELVLVAHTGRAVFEVGAERARGATRLDDWADVRWMLTKDADEARYFAAQGRDVDVPEMQLDYSAAKRQLTANGKGGRKAAKAQSTRDRILAAIEATPGIGAGALWGAVKGVRRADAVAERDLLEAEGRIRVERHGNGSSANHFLRGPSVLERGVVYGDD